MSQRHVAILLCTLNGERYLADQLASYGEQRDVDWSLWVSDDHSTDSTREILAEYRQRQHGRDISIEMGPAQGYAANFLSLACNPRIQADYYAYSDQDDIWDPFKLSTAVSWLEAVSSSTPALYCSRTSLIDTHGKPVALSPLFERPPSFANALTQNIAGGNTMVLNRAARDLLLEAGADVPVVSHDWWTYQVVTGCGGVIRYDARPTVRYRQHHANAIGGNSTVMKRVRSLLSGRMADWNDGHINALRRIDASLVPSNRKALEHFIRMRQGYLPDRFREYFKSGIYRQTFLGTAALWVAIMLRRV